MRNLYAVATLTQKLVQLVGNKNAAVLSTGAAHADYQLSLALVDVLGHQKIQKLLLQLEVLKGLGIAADKISHRAVIARLAAQLLHLEGVGQKAHVQH